jgi:biopolymer transport protein TolQ
MTQDLSIVSLVMHASLVVQIVMVGLLLASLASWTVIFGKLFGLRKVRTDNDEFEREFWAGRNLNDLFADATKQAPRSAMERIFASGMREFFKLREKRVVDPGALLDGAAGRCGRASSASWTRSSRISPSSPRSARSRPTSACSARSGESCMRSSACRTCSR